MAILSPEWWGVLLSQPPAGGEDDVGPRGRPELWQGEPWADGGEWWLYGPSPDNGPGLADVHPLVVLARRTSQRGDDWSLSSSAPNPAATPGPVVLEWTPAASPLSQAPPTIEPLVPAILPPLQWLGIAGDEELRDVVQADGLWLITPPAPASTWSGGTLRVADATSGAHTFVEFLPFAPRVTALLLHMDETQLADDILGGLAVLIHDDAAGSWNCRLIGDAELVEAGARFGGGIALSGGHVQCPEDAFPGLSRAAFTIEWFVKPDAAGSSADACYLQMGDAGVIGSITVRRDGATSPHRLRVDTVALAGSETTIAAGLASEVAPGGWHHVALVVAGESLALFVDGQPAGQGVSAGFEMSGNRSITVGNNAGGAAFHGLVDEMRLSSGALYTEAFDVPTAPFAVEAGGGTQTEVFGYYALNLADPSFDWVVWLTHSDAVVSDAGDKPLVRDTSPFKREIRGSGLTRTAQIKAAGVMGNAIQIGDQPDARVYAVTSDPSLNFRGHPFTLEARVSRQSPSHPLVAYADCCLFWLGSWSFVLTARGSLAVRQGPVVRTESGALTVIESDPGLIDLSGRAMPLRTVALTRNAEGVCTIWLDGQPVASGTFNPPSTIEAGLSGPSARDGLAAFTRFDEVRWTNGLCRYTGPYTPETVPFPDYGGNQDPPPSAVLNLRLTAVNSRSLAIAWDEPIAGGAVDGYVVEWAEAGTHFAQSLNMAVAQEAVTIAGLEVASRYDVRVFAFNAAGPGLAATLMNVSTSALALPGAPAGLAVGDPEPAALPLTWLAPAVTGDAPITGYALEAALADTGFASIVRSFTVTEAGAAASGGGYEATVDGLVPATTYDVRVAAVSAAGRGAWATSLGNATALHPDAGALLVDGLLLELDGLALMV